MTERVDRFLRPLLISLAILAPLWLVSLILSIVLPLQPPPPPVSPLRLPEGCVLTVTQVLSDMGTSAATAFNPDGTLLVTIPYDLAEDAPQDEGAQAVWAAFDAAAGLPETCPFRRLQVTVWSGDLQLQAQATATDLRSWEEETLDDDDFADLVTYTQQIIPPPAP